MKKTLSSLLALALLVLALALPASAQTTGRIYLYGESHSTQAHLDQELAAWGELYQNQGVRDLFLETPSYAASYLNLWMKAEGDGVLTRLYEDWEGTAGCSQATWDFYQAIKASYPETVFHGFDVGHQYSTTGTRYLMGLFLSGQMGSADWDLTQKTIDQGKTYYQTQDSVYRENQMTANLREMLDALPEGTSVMVITGSAHSDLYRNDLSTGTVPCMANQLRQIYGENLIAKNLTAGFDYSQTGQTAFVTMAGQSYTALRLADQDLSGLPGYQSRTFWLVQDAYPAAKTLPLTGEVLPADRYNYPWEVKEGEVFAVHYLLADGSSSWSWYRSDGTTWEGQPTTLAFDGR